ncbi:TetR/AcrR family transcriptional regulator [Dactylosporangium sp. CA-092794]|uniref:TetR/AcrR family transcriptional regulator n=1 Tax=Dactylosporangium sp. CA-092794 TaxID=3239929 RepID=UPI003D89FAFF
MTTNNPPAAPARGTRPRNRRTLILAAAADLFVRRGYDQVGVGDIAEAVAIGPSALYRHFPGKQHLLREVIAAGVAPLRELVDDLDVGDRAAALRRLAALALDERHLGVLWQREARHLPADDRAAVLAGINAVERGLAARVRDLRPELGGPAADLLARCLVAVLTSPSFHRLELPRPEHDELLAGLAAAVLDSPVPAGLPGAPPGPAPAGLVPDSRREALLMQAVRLFAAHGYAAVGNDDIGAAVGIAGPSIYNHFASKIDLLNTAFDRGAAVLFTDLSAAYRTAGSPIEALHRLVRSYLAFTHANHDLVSLLITEIGHLPGAGQHRARQTQHDYISEWVHLLRADRPGVDPTHARARVHAVLGIANDAARTPHLRRNPHATAALETICTRLLMP